MTRMIAAAEFKAAVREMLDGLGDEPLDADALKARVEALVDAAATDEPIRKGLLPGSFVWLVDEDLGPVDPDWEAEWEANNPPELYR